MEDFKPEKDQTDLCEQFLSRSTSLLSVCLTCKKTEAECIVKQHTSDHHAKGKYFCVSHWWNVSLPTGICCVGSHTVSGMELIGHLRRGRSVWHAAKVPRCNQKQDAAGVRDASLPLDQRDAPLLLFLSIIAVLLRNIKHLLWYIIWPFEIRSKTQGIDFDVDLI